VFKLLFQPGVALMRRLTFPKKFVVVSIFLLLPLLLARYFLSVDIDSQIELAKREQLGLQQVRPYLALLPLMQLHRGLSNVVLSGAESFKPEIPKTQAAIDTLFIQIDRQIKAAPGEQFALRETSALREKWNALKSIDAESGAAKAFQARTAMIADLLSAIRVIAIESNLVLDSNSAGFHLVTLFSDKLPRLAEIIAQARGLSAGLAAKKTMNADERSRLSVLAMLGAAATPEAAATFAVALKNAPEINAALSGSAKSLQLIDPYIQSLDKSFLNALTIKADTGETFSAGANVTVGIMQFTNGILPLMDGILQQRIESVSNRMLWRDLAGIFSIAIAAYLLGALFLATKSSIGFLHKTVSHITDGDLTSHIQLRGNDEIADLMGRLQTMQSALSKMVSDVNESAEMVFLASSQIVYGTENLASRTEAQSANLQQTAASMSVLTSSVEKNTQGAQDANDLAKGAAQVAREGRISMNSVAQTMNEIATSAKQIESIVGVIDGIAFQTNILALNAAVEAARAGEQGRGFAVVAAEVRNLAQRVTASAKEIKQLVNSTTSKVDAGTRLVDDAAKTIQETAIGIQRVAQINGEIALASNEQRIGIDHVSQAVSQMDESNIQNATLVEQTSASAASLRDQADALVRSVGRFKVRSSDVAPVAMPAGPPIKKATLPTALRQTQVSEATAKWTEF
jgi:methyl-accepting chemotaxis protein